MIKTWSFNRGTEVAERELFILQKFADDRYIGADVLIGAGNTELFVRDVLELDCETDLKFFKQWAQKSLQFS